MVSTGHLYHTYFIHIVRISLFCMHGRVCERYISHWLQVVDIWNIIYSNKNCFCSSNRRSHAKKKTKCFVCFLMFLCESVRLDLASYMWSWFVTTIKLYGYTNITLDTSWNIGLNMFISAFQQIYHRTFSIDKEI